jgi:hypothetical protein
MMAEDNERFIADAQEDIAMGIGPMDSMRFIGFGLLSRLRESGLTDDEIYKRLSPGKAAYTESQLK